jgi:ferredoxin
MLRKTTEPEVLPGADDELDCQPVVTDSDAGSAGAESLVVLPVEEGPEVADEEEAEDHHEVTWSTVQGSAAAEDVLNSWRPVRGRWSVALERLALAVERPINRLTSVQLNPLYHTGTIAFFLLALVGLTGLYLFFFFQYGFDASYNAVGRMESQLIARVIRAVHRYASGALVITTMLHAYRTLFLEKFRGPRWLAWLTGMAMTAMVWLAGVTGYWLIWDVRAQVITDRFVAFVDALTGFGPRLAVVMNTAGEQGSSWAVLLLILAAHVLLFLGLVGFFVIHIKRLKRPKWLPPVHWVAAVAGVLLVLSALFPVGMLAPADLDRLPGTFGIDPLFLFYLPFGAAWWFWLGLGLAFLGVAALPWLSRLRRRNGEATTAAVPGQSPAIQPRIMLPPPVNILKDRCTGCTKCALDCPYGAIEMVERHDGKPHKYIAIEDTALCVSCGICVGSCDGVAVTMGQAMPESLWQLVEAQPAAAPVAVIPEPVGAIDDVPEGIAGRTVIYTCDRHARHGARPYLHHGATPPAPGEPVVVVLPCVGALPPDLAVRTLKAGAAEVRVIGCPPDDCANREGNLWAEQRLTRERLPRLRKAYAGAPIAAFWLAPDDFARGIDAPIPLDEAGQPDYAAARSLPAALSWRNLVPAVLMLAAVLLMQILLNDIPFTPYPDPQAVVRLMITEGAAPFGRLAPEGNPDPAYDLEIIVDGAVVATQRVAAANLLSNALEESTPLFLEQSIAPGEHEVVVQLRGTETGTLDVLYSGTVSLAAGQVLRLMPVFDFGADCPAGPNPDESVRCER